MAAKISFQFNLEFTAICTIQYVTNGITQFYVLRNVLIYAPITALTVGVSDFNTGRKGFKQYLIVGRYLGVALNGLSLF